MSLTRDQALELRRTARNLAAAEADLLDPAEGPRFDSYKERAETYLEALADHRTSVADGFAEHDERADTLVVDDTPAGQAAADAELLREQVAAGTGMPHSCCYGEAVPTVPFHKATRHDPRCGHETMGEWAERHGYAPPEDIAYVVLPKCHPDCDVLARAMAFGSAFTAKLGAD